MDPYQYNELAMLAMASGSSNFGGGGEYGNDSIPLCNVQLPPWMARAWTITLGSMRGASSAGGATIPPDYQVNTDPSLFKVSVEWGVGGASESCEFDYPWAGMVVTLFGANIVVRTSPAAKTVGGGPPRVAAFIAPGARGANAEHSQPTYTRAINIDGISGEVRTLVPRRARAYRLSVLDEDPSSFNASVYQEMARGPAQLCCDRFSGSGNIVSTVFPGAPSPPWTPLLSGTNQLFVQGPAGVPLYVTFALDLG